MKTASASPLDWSHAITEIPDVGLARKRALSAEERDAVAAALNLLALSDAGVDYRIERLAGGAYRLHGSLQAKLAQPCVVTLEPVAGALDEAFDVEFWPALEQTDAGEDARILEGRDVERLDGGDIPVGRIAFETLSSALDPYPRTADAEFEWRDEKQSDAGKVSPFSVLSQLKDKR